VRRPAEKQLSPYRRERINGDKEMKEIKAIIQPHRLEMVLEGLRTHPDLPGVTISSVQGFGRTVGRDKIAKADSVEFGTVNMMKVECVIDDEMLDDIIEIIRRSAHTGLTGDGKIVIYDVNEMVKIKTGLRSEHVI
jgi:nitrogen regulatory protein P-II 1